MRHFLFAVPLLLATISAGACATKSESQTGTQALTQIQQQDLDSRLTFLGSTASVTVLDPNGSGSSAMAQLNAAIQADPDTTSWIANAGSEIAPHILSLTMNDGTSGTLVTREWVNGDPSSPSSRAAITFVSDPAGNTFAYAEQHVYSGGGTDTGTLYALGNGVEQVSTYTFDPAALGGGADAGFDVTNVDASFDAAPPQDTTASQDAGSQGGGGGDDAAASQDDAGPDAGPDAAMMSRPHTSPVGKGPGPVRQSKKDPVECIACADTLLALKLVGIGAAYATGTGAATAVCGLVGIPTAEVGGVACHLVVAALSTASFLPTDYASRAGVCDWVSATVLGLDPICPAYQPVAPKGPVGGVPTVGGVTATGATGSGSGSGQ